MIEFKVQTERLHKLLERTSVFKDVKDEEFRIDVQEMQDILVELIKHRNHVCPRPGEGRQDVWGYDG